MEKKKVVITNKELFKSTKKFLCNDNREFTHVSSGSVERIVTEDKEYLFVDLTENSGRGHHLSKMLKRDVDNWLVDNGDKLGVYNNDYKEQMFNLSAIENRIGIPMVAIDINDCYWHTAYKLGYIKEETYIKGKRFKEWKVGRNASIGSLSKTEIHIPYFNGKPSYKNKKVIRPDIRYQNIRNHIIGYVYQSFFRLHQDIGNNFCMFLTDCVYTTTNNLRYVERFFKDDGYKVKFKPMEFIKVDRKEKRVYWYDFEAENKDGKKGVDKYYIYANHQVIDGVIYPIENRLKTTNFNTQNTLD